MVLLGQALAEDGTGPGTGDVGGDPAADDPGGPEDAHAQDGERGGDGGAGGCSPGRVAPATSTTTSPARKPRSSPRAPTARPGCVQAMLAAEIARRTGTNPQRDLYPRLAAAALISAVRAALDHWLDADPATPLHAVVSQALGQLADGLPAPNDNERTTP